MSCSSSTQKPIKRRLETLIQGARAAWTYARFWDLSSADSELSLTWTDGYYLEENDSEEIRKNSPLILSASSLQKLGIEVLSSSIGGGLTHAERFFRSSRRTRTAHGRDINCRNPLWITGDGHLAVSDCIRARVAQAFGFQTLALIPAANGVVELGSVYWITQRYEFDLSRKVREVLDSAGSKTTVCFQDRALVSGPPSPLNESESSNSVENNTNNNNNIPARLSACDDGVESNFTLPPSKMAVSLGLNLGLNTIRRAIRPKIELIPSSSGVRGGKPSFSGQSKRKDTGKGKRKRDSGFRQPENSMFSINNNMGMDLDLSLTLGPVKPKPHFQSSSLQPRCYGNSASDSDNADINAFIRILRRDS